MHRQIYGTGDSLNLSDWLMQPSLKVSIPALKSVADGAPNAASAIKRKAAPNPCYVSASKTSAKTLSKRDGS
jgi:hypothetical protein